MGGNKKTGTRSCKGTVSIAPYRSGLRLRWRHNGRRYELFLPSSDSQALLKSKNIKHVIEEDIAGLTFDETLNRYRKLLQVAALGEWIKTQLNNTSPEIGNKQLHSAVVTSTEILPSFDNYLAIINKVDDTNYYALTRKALVKWGTFTIDEVPFLLSKEKWSAKTFNDRRNCLKTFFNWMKRKKKIADNPLDDLPTRKRDRMHADREPFTDQEGSQILDALRSNRFVKKSSRFSHSHYYPFVAFLLHIGCRPGEAIGLKVRYVKFDEGVITIGNSLARTVKGSHAAVRVYKSTKNMKVRHIPMDKFLIELLGPLCKGREPEEYVFLTEKGNVIDDKMFLRRVFKPIQTELKIPVRVLYCLRHTFATRAVRHGMKPSEVAYLMGDNTETILSNYFHNNMMPEQLPGGVPAIMQTMEMFQCN